MRSTTLILLISLCGLMSCDAIKSSNNDDSSKKVIDVNAAYFTAVNANISIKTVSCTLSDGTKTKCYEIVTNSTPTDHQMGPWCPTNISDDANAGGIWLKDGQKYDVDGEFIQNLATLYEDDTWQMYDENGDVYVTKTEEDCINAANPNVGKEYENFCVECLPSYINDVSQTYLIPITPVYQKTPTAFMGRGGRPERGHRPDRPKRPEGDHEPRGDRPRPDRPRSDRPGGHRPERGGIPSTRGIALNGVEFSAPAPLDAILSAYTLAPFDDAGGHINVHQGYHYHITTGISYSIKQEDGHAPLIGYALDGYAIYAFLDENGEEPTDLDQCRGHYDEIRGYHYHVDAAGNNNFIDCLHGAYVK